MTTAPRAGSGRNAGAEKASSASALPSDTYFGTRVADPFRALEDGESASTKAWEKGESDKLAAYLAAGPDRTALAAEAKALLDGGSLEAPHVSVQGARRRYFWKERSPGMKQPVYYVAEGLKGKPRALIDVGAMAATTSLDWAFPSPKGNYVAWGESRGGSEESVLHLRDVATGKDVGESIDRARHTQLAWLPDESGFVYSRRPAPGSVPAGETQFHVALYMHKRGTSADKDVLLYTPKDKTWETIPSISPDGKWLAMAVERGWDRNDVYVALMSAPTQWDEIREEQPFTYQLEARNDGLYMLTTEGAPKGQLFRISYKERIRDYGSLPGMMGNREGRMNEVVVDQADGTLTNVAFGTSGRLALQYMQNAVSRVELVTLGRTANGIPSQTEPKVVASSGTLSLASSEDGREIFVEQRGFTSPGAVTLVSQKESTPWRSLKAAVDLSELVAERFEATSKDGTKVPYDVLRAKNLTGPAPGILYGYGGFNIAVTPSYSPRALLGAKHGLVWAQAVLRGGSEFGEAWHQAGMKTHKQNVFDDYLAVAQDLVARKLVDPARLAAMGGSNGGLLVSAAITQRPDLFRAGVSLVPLTDMIRFPLFRLGKLWVSEYGDLAKEDEFRALYTYSPYHNVKQGTAYPAMLYTTAPNDTRVDPMHARKMVAALQAANPNGKPVLLRIDQEAGHGAGKPTDKLATEYADIYSFVLQELSALPAR